ncbi:MAG: response regulator [Clostridia bacterium]|nr:response regulator [Clostridia bacterium]
MLIVDDDRMYCDTLNSYFADTGLFEMQLPAYGGSEAVRRIENTAPDILLLDALMPEKDGAAVLCALEEKGISKGIDVFVITPYLSGETVRLFENLGVKYIFIKPVDNAVVVRRIQKLSGVLCDSSSDMVKSRDKAVCDAIVCFLRMISISPKLMGYRYLKCLLEYSVEFYGKEKTNKELCMRVAQEFNTEWKNVDRNIRTAIDSAWINGSMEGQYALFGYTVSSSRGRPTNKELISMITERVIESLAHR